MHANIVKSHPLFVGAALSVILCSLVAAAAITGVIPGAISQRSAAQPAKAAPALPTCANCGTVEAIRQVQLSGSPSGVGAVAGGLTGAVVGSQFGRGDGRTALTVLGAAGGALAGNEIEKHVRKRTVYRVVVRLDDGTTRTVSQPSAPAFAVGERVRVQGNALERS